jgi:hypothetical protein
MRVYTIEFDNVSVSAAQDLLAAYCGANMAVEVHSFVIGQVTASTVGNLRIRLRRLPATVTAGSGGTTPTPAKVGGTNDSAATFTAHANDTTQATTSGTAVTLHADAFNVVNGYQWVFLKEDRPSAKPNEALVLSLDSPPGSAETMSGTMTVAELF